MQKSKIATTNSAHHLYPANKGAKGSASPANLSPRKSGRDTAVALAKKAPKEEVAPHGTFTRLDLKDPKLAPDIKAIAEAYKVDTNKWNKAAIQDQDGSLVIACEGKIAADKLFRGTNFLSRTWYRMTSFFRNSDVTFGTKAYTENFLAAADKDAVLGEDLGHLVDGLNSNHYHAVLVFSKGKDGKHDPSKPHIGIVDSFGMLMEPFLKKHGDHSPELVQAAKAQYENAFALDKLVVSKEAMEAKVDIISIYHTMAEALAEMQPYNLLTLPTAIHKDPSMDSDSQNFLNMSLFIPVQTSEGWKALGQKAWLKNSWFASPEERKKFESFIQDTHCGLTLSRPLADKNKGMNASLAWALATSQTYAGSESRIESEDELKMIDLLAKVNAHLINDFNEEHGLEVPAEDPLAKIVQEDLNEGKHLLAEEAESQDAPKSEEKNGSWWSRLFGGAKKEEKPTEPTPEAESAASEEASTEEAEVEAESDGEVVDEDDSVELAEEEHSSSTARSAKPSKPGVA